MHLNLLRISALLLLACGTIGCGTGHYQNLITVSIHDPSQRLEGPPYAISVTPQGYSYSHRPSTDHPFRTEYATQSIFWMTDSLGLAKTSGPEILDFEISILNWSEKEYLIELPFAEAQAGKVLAREIAPDAFYPLENGSTLTVSYQGRRLTKKQIHRKDKGDYPGWDVEIEVTIPPRGELADL